MMNYEFDVLYDKLIKANKAQFDGFNKKKNIAMAVQSLPKAWFEEIVQEIVKNPKAKINIEERARQYRFKSRTIVEIRQVEPEGVGPVKTLAEYLKELGASDPVDAISKVKNYGVAK